MDGTPPQIIRVQYQAGIKSQAYVQGPSGGGNPNIVRTGRKRDGSCRVMCNVCSSIRAVNPFDPQSRLVVLEGVIDAAVNVEDQPENATTDKLNEFVSCLKNESMVERYTFMHLVGLVPKLIAPSRMATAKSKDNKKATQSAAQSLRLDNLLEKVKQVRSTYQSRDFAAAEKQSRLHFCAASTSSQSPTLALML